MGPMTPALPGGPRPVGGLGTRSFRDEPDQLRGGVAPPLVAAGRPRSGGTGRGPSGTPQPREVLHAEELGHLGTGRVGAVIGAKHGAGLGREPPRHPLLREDGQHRGSRRALGGHRQVGAGAREQDQGFPAVRRLQGEPEPAGRGQTDDGRLVAGPVGSVHATPSGHSWGTTSRTRPNRPSSSRHTETRRVPRPFRQR